MPNKLIIVDDELLFREGLKRIFLELGDFEIVQEFSDGKDLINYVKEDNDFDLILLDFSMPLMDGIDALRELMKIDQNIKVAVLSSHYDGGLIVKMIELGAASFFAKNTPPGELIEGVNNIVERGFHYTDYIVKLLRTKMVHGSVDKSKIVSLSLREKEVLLKLCEQKTAKEIATELFISPRTVEGHRNKLLEKTNSKNIAGLIIHAVENGFFSIRQRPKFQ